MRLGAPSTSLGAKFSGKRWEIIFHSDGKVFTHPPRGWVVRRRVIAHPDAGEACETSIGLLDAAKRIRGVLHALRRQRIRRIRQLALGRRGLALGSRGFRRPRGEFGRVAPNVHPAE